MSAPSLSPDRIVELSEDDETAAPVKEWHAALSAFKAEALGDLVVGVQNLTFDGKGVDRSEAMAFILDNEGLREEVFNEIITSGTLADAAEKD